tara:strand:+ start:8905 stop:9105 length:201 start_codon:yes stop_codon:yes gene_type:complete
MAKTKERMYRWNYNEEVTADEYIQRLSDLVLPALDNLQALEGDMYLSDYRSLVSASWRITNRNDTT